MAEYVRQYQLKHANFNRHRKYKHLRPLYPLGGGAPRLAEQDAGQVTGASLVSEPGPTLEEADRPGDVAEEAKMVTLVPEAAPRPQKEVPESLADLEFEAMLARLEKKCANLEQLERGGGSGGKAEQ